MKRKPMKRLFALVLAPQGRVWQKSPGKQESQFPSSASLRLETKHTVVSNPHTPPF